MAGMRRRRAVGLVGFRGECESEVELPRFEESSLLSCRFWTMSKIGLATTPCSDGRGRPSARQGSRVVKSGHVVSCQGRE